ncbi:MAG: cytochrome c [Kyrpidia sp.]|nr:cytochrome c [Kyrpidia sp.]
MKRWQGMTLAALPVVLGILFIIGVFADWFPIQSGHSIQADAGAGGSETSPGSSGGSAGGSGGQDMTEAKQIVSTQCASCHGADLNGAVGPNLHERAKALSKDQIVAVLKNGKGIMPGNLVPGKEEAVAAFIKSLAQ